MVATPLTLADALNFNGYTIGQTANPAFTIATPTGIMNIPAMMLSTLTYQYAGPPAPIKSFYLTQLPIFDPAYLPVILSHILDQYRTRRIGYDTPDMFGLALRRWANRQLGPQSILNRRYLSTAVALPLTTDDSTTDVTGSATNTNTDHARDAFSDFPQGQLAANLDYSSSATDRAATNTGNASNIGHGAAGGRSATSVMTLLAEQRAAFINADSELLDALDPLFLGVWDRSEIDTGYADYSPISTAAGYW